MLHIVFGVFESSLIRGSMVLYEVSLKFDLEVVVEKFERSRQLGTCSGRSLEKLDSEE